MDSIKKIIENKFDIAANKDKKRINIKLENEDHTVGAILNDYLQDDKNIAFSGLSKPDMLVREVVIKILSVDNNPFKHVYNAINSIIQVATDLKTELTTLSKKK
jgi:DNA-directed RNA polymerase subunit L